MSESDNKEEEVKKPVDAQGETPSESQSEPKNQPETKAESTDQEQPASEEKAEEKSKTEDAPKTAPGGKPGADPGQKKQSYKAGGAKEEPVSEFVEKILSIKRVTKVTKGGKKLSFSALAVVGDTKGKVGYSLGKGGEVAIAIRKALVKAKKNMIGVPMKGTSIPHEIIGVCGGATVMLKPASEGTGVIAAGPVRAVCDGAGIHNILTKCHRSNNPINVVKATFDGLQRLKTKRNDESPIEELSDAIA